MNASAPVFEWRDYLPLAKAETSKFYKKQERGKFRYDELLSVAEEALGRSPGATYAKKAIRGALTDHARDAYKLVRNVEMSEEDYLRTWGSPAPTGRPTVVKQEDGVTYYTPAPYRTNAQLLAGDGKVGKHGKVSITLERTTYNDERGQNGSGQVRAKIEDEENRNCDPRSARMGTPRGDVDQVEYTGRDREKRFSTSCHNHGGDYKSGLGAPDTRYDDDKVTVTYCGKKPRSVAEVIRRHAVASIDAGVSGQRTSCVSVRMDRFGLEPVPKDKLGRWREELLADELRSRRAEFGEPTASSPSWQREAGYFRVEWGLHDRPNGWGDNWLKAYLDRWGTVRDKAYEYLILKSSLKSSNRADILTRDSLEQDVPRRLASGSACLGGSWRAQPTIFSGILPDRRNLICASNR